MANNPGNKNFGYGRALLDSVMSQVPAFGRLLVVKDADDSTVYNYQDLSEIFDDGPTDGRLLFFNTLEAAYDAAQSNNNDVICLDGQSTHVVATMITWSKNRVHVIGFDGGDRLVQQGAKVELSGNVAVAAVVKCTGVRNSFRNLKVIQSSTNAAAINVWQFAGEGNCYKNCSFLFGVTDNLDLTTAAEALMGEDAGTFINCSFGTDVLLSTAGAGRAVMRIDAISGASSADGMKSCRFVDCEWLIMSSSADANLILLQDTAGAKFLSSFVRPRFQAVINNSNSAIAITNAIASAAGFVEGTLAFFWPTTVNCTNGCTTADNVRIAGAPVFSSNAWEGGTPA